MNVYSYNNTEVIIMSNINEQVLDKMVDILSVASDKTRLKIMLSLLDESKCSCGSHNHCGTCEHRSCMIEKCVSEIMVDTNASQSLVSHQLKILKDIDLVSTRREGTRIYYSLKDGHVKQLISVVLEHALED